MKYDKSSLTGDDVCQLIAQGRLDEVEGAYTAKELAELTNMFDRPALACAAAHGQLKQIKGGATWQQLFEARGWQYQENALFEAIAAGGLLHLRGGVTARELMSATGTECTGLHLVARYGCYEQVRGGVTCQLLSQCCNYDGNTPLHYAAQFRTIDRIPGDVTWRDLKAARNKSGWSALNACAVFGALHQLRIPASAGVLFGDVMDMCRTALESALITGQLDAIRGTALPRAIQSRLNLDNAMKEAIQNECIPGIRDLLRVKAKPDLLKSHLKDLGDLSEIYDEVEDKECQIVEWKDHVFQAKDDFHKYVYDMVSMLSGLDLPDVANVIDPRLTALCI